MADGLDRTDTVFVLSADEVEDNRVGQPRRRRVSCLTGLQLGGQPAAIGRAFATLIAMSAKINSFERRKLYA